MDLQRENDRKGLVGTVFIHIIIFLLLMIMIIGDKDQMVEAKEGVEISFGEPEQGGSDATSEVANTQETAAQPNSSPNEVEATPTPDPSVVTNDKTDAPEVKTSPAKPAKKADDNIEPADINSELKKRLEALKANKANSDKNQNAGNGPKKGPGGDPDSDKVGPGGLSSGNIGNGIGYSLQGFSASGTPIENERQTFGKVTMRVTLDKNGNIKNIVFDGGTTSDPYLIELATRSIKQFNFKANGSEKATNVGTFTFTYLPQ